MDSWWWIVIAASAAAIALPLGWGLRGLRSKAPADPTPTVAERAIAAASDAYVVVDDEGTLLLANHSAERLGIVSGDILDPRIADGVIELARGSYGRSPGGVRHEDPLVWELTGDPERPAVLRVSARSVGSGMVLVTATDETAARQLEVVRRDFVANVSHELKSPVTAIGLLAEAVAEAADSADTVRGFAEQMQRESARLGALITELIALSALQDGDLAEQDLVPIDEVIGDAVNQASVAAGAADISIVVKQHVGAVVLGDRSLLATALSNLVNNAVHYSGTGSTVTISQTIRRESVDIAVSDTGIGIAPADQRRVFERFFRADPARSRATGGTGLGLAIVKHVAANHGGSIRLRSRIGEGSTFTLRLPLAPRSGETSEDAPTLAVAP